MPRRKKVQIKSTVFAVNSGRPPDLSKERQMPVCRIVALLAFYAAGLAFPLAAVAQPSALARIEAYVKPYVSSGAFQGIVLVARKDRVIYEKGFGDANYELGVKVSAANRFRIASLTKDITKAAIGRLMMRSRIALDDPLAKFLPDFPNAKAISIRALVENRSGVPHTNNLAWMDMTKPMDLSEIVARLAKEPLDFPPGTQYRYSNGGYALLAAVIEAVSGKSYGQFVQDEFTLKGYPSIGREDAFQVVPKMADRYAPGPAYGERERAPAYLVSNRIGGGDLYANADDLFHFFRALYFGTLLPPEIGRELFRREKGVTQLTGQSPGTLAQISFDETGDTTVLTLSSNSSWPAGFNMDLLKLSKGEDVDLEPVQLAEEGRSDGLAGKVVGRYESGPPYNWHLAIERAAFGLTFQLDDQRSSIALTQNGAFHVPLFDWLCAPDAGGLLTCRQRNRSSTARFGFRRIGSDAANDAK